MKAKLAALLGEWLKEGFRRNVGGYWLVRDEDIHDAAAWLAARGVVIRTEQEAMAICLTCHHIRTGVGVLAGREAPTDE